MREQRARGGGGPRLDPFQRLLFFSEVGPRSDSDFLTRRKSDYLRELIRKKQMIIVDNDQIC